MTTKTRVVLDLNTRVKVINASERDKFSVKQIMTMFNVGKTHVYEMLKKKTKILLRWENCANGKIERELKETANEDVNEILWEWFVSVRAKITACRVLWYRNVLKSSLKNWGRLSSKHLTDGWRVFAKDIR